jgi:formylglycine-generating enzyme required for sulfatase activity
MKNTPDKNVLRTVLIDRFDETELIELCESLGDINYTHLSGEKRKRVFDLVAFYERRNSLRLLWTTMTDMRPDIHHTEEKLLSRDKINSSISNHIKELSLVEFGGYVSGMPRLSASINDIFIHLKLTKPLPINFNILNTHYENRTDQQQSINWDGLLELGNRHIVMGPLGCGKSFLLRKIFIQYADMYLHYIDDTDKKPILPVYISLKDILNICPASEHVNVECFKKLIEKFWDNEGTWSQLSGYVNSMLLLLDGLDELPKDFRSATLVALKKLLDTYQPASTIITVRKDEFSLDFIDPSDHFLLSAIRPFESGDQDILIRNLSRLAQMISISEEAILTDASSVIFAPDLSEDVTRPLYLTTCFLVYLIHSHMGTSLASIKTHINKRIAELALGDWDQIKSVNPPYNSSDIKAGWLAAFIAYEAFKQSVENSVDVTEIEVSGENITRLLVGLDMPPSTEKVKQNLAQITNSFNRSEILKCDSTALHQEYCFQRSNDVPVLAASYLVDMTATEREQLLIKRLKSKDWEPIIHNTFDLLLVKSSIEANQFIDFITENGNIPPNDYSRMLYLAGQCITHTKKNLGSTKKVIDNILIILSNIRQTVDLEYRINIAEIMGIIGDPRLGTMITIPEGEFWRGYDPFPNDRPVEKIWVHEFSIDIYPVTNHQFGEFINAGGYERDQYWDPDGWKWIRAIGRHHPKHWTDPRFNKNNYPVVGVSWFEADAYARWAGKRLPSEVEWEKAARGEYAYEWPWGMFFNPEYLNCSVSLPVVHGTTPIGIYPAGQSPYGVYDMAGNVSEWTSDWYKPYSPDSNKSPHDSHYGEKYKVRRGGGWGWDHDFARCTCRNASPLTADYAILGFRCAIGNNILVEEKKL